jgi:hypothetical protein
MSNNSLCPVGTHSEGFKSDASILEKEDKEILEKNAEKGTEMAR